MGFGAAEATGLGFVFFIWGFFHKFEFFPPPPHSFNVYQVAMDEGVLALWKGFIPYFSRLGPHTVMTFLLLEQVRYYGWGGGGKTKEI